MTKKPGPGAGVLAELLWVHDLLRRDLAECRRLADEVASGTSTAQVRASVDRLKTRGPLWHLRVNCLSYCAFVHAHHCGEDRTLFPAVRRTDPARLTPIVNRLVADHRKIGERLDEVDGATRNLGGGDAESRQRLVEALRQLADHLLEHLAYEEEQLTPVLRSWGRA